MLRTVRGLLIAVSTVSFASIAHAQIVVPGADGSDGSLIIAPNEAKTIDLSEAVSGVGLNWLSPTPSGSTGKGVYDPEQWAVVFKYSSVVINSGGSLRFKNHPTKAPVAWLVSGSVTVHPTAVIDIQGPNSVVGQIVPSESPPGGFAGGTGKTSALQGSSMGRGPGAGVITTDQFGSTLTGHPAAYGTFGAPSLVDPDAPTQLYGSHTIFPLIGGSGGGGGTGPGHSGVLPPCTGGSGGGAILIACQGTFTLNGSILADGGGSLGVGAGWYPVGSGSGGAIRLIAGGVVGQGVLRALGGLAYNSQSAGGSGRIRIEVPQGGYQGQLDSAPVPSISTTIGSIFPDLATQPRLQILSIDATPVPADPRASTTPFDQDVTVDSGLRVVRVEAKNIPAGWLVYVRVSPQYNTPQYADLPKDYPATASGVDEYSCVVTIPKGPSIVFARAYDPAAY